MRRFGRRGFLRLFLSSCLAALFTGKRLAYAGGVTTRLRLLATTDIHAYLAAYDYFRDAPSDRVGLARVASLVRAARAEVANTLLFDNGDLLEGSPLDAYIATRKTLKPGDVHPAYKAMNVMGYDAATVGNHDFNYGMAFLDRALAGAAFPYVCANVYRAGTDAPYFRPYMILDRQVVDEAGERQPIRIGVLGLVTPQIVVWARRQLDGRIATADMVEAARRYVPEMRAAGADIVVVLAHTGLTPPPVEPGGENVGYALTQIPGIDALVVGHMHRVFPDIAYGELPNFDAVRGTLNGIPVSMAGFYGSHLGVIDLDLSHGPAGWRVDSSRSEARPLHRSLAPPDHAVMQAIEDDHSATLDYIRQPVGTLPEPLDSYFALAAPSPLLATVAEAQLWAARQAIADQRDLFGDRADLPLLAATAPGKSGPDLFTVLDSGPVNMGHIADLYPYPNVLEIVEIDGAALREWLEMSATLFRHIQSAHTRPQNLTDSSFRGYDFDVMHGVTYTIDVTQPCRYRRGGGLADRATRRIVDLAWQGAPVNDSDRFLVATNNYRASGGGSFPGLDGRQSIYRSQDSMQTTLVAWLGGGNNLPAPAGPWHFATMPPDATVYFDTSADAAGGKLPPGMAYLGPSKDGLARFQIGAA